MAGVCRKLEGFALIVGGYYDHAHLLVRIPAKIAVSDFVGRVKANTSKHIVSVRRDYLRASFRRRARRALV
jgi:REP element-mobilizing transposase RayT